MIIVTIYPHKPVITVRKRSLGQSHVFTDVCLSTGGALSGSGGRILSGSGSGVLSGSWGFHPGQGERGPLDPDGNPRSTIGRYTLVFYFADFQVL